MDTVVDNSSKPKPVRTKPTGNCPDLKLSQHEENKGELTLLGTDDRRLVLGENRVEEGLELPAKTKGAELRIETKGSELRTETKGSEHPGETHVSGESLETSNFGNEGEIEIVS